MPYRCVAAGSSYVPDPFKSIGLHKFPENNDSARNTPTLWITFVGQRVRNGLPPATSRLRSQHFE